MASNTASGAPVREMVPVARAIAHKAAAGRLGAAETEELVGAAYEGLVVASERFDAKRGVPFGAYARHRIQGAVVDAMRAGDWVPRTVRDRANRLDAARRKLRSALGRDATVHELANELHLSVADTHAMVRQAEIRVMVSLDAPVDHEMSQPLVESIADEQQPENDTLDRQRLKAALAKAVDQLPERERTAIVLFYLEDLTLKEIGQVLGVTEGRVSQLCSQGVKRLRVALGGFGDGC